MTVKSVLICALVLVLFLGAQSQEIGQECTVRKTGRAGICTKAYSCDDALDDLRANRSPTFCKLRNLRDLVCCPKEEVNNFGRISERKCAEYSSAVFETISIVPLVANGKTMYVKKDKCGHTVLPLIVSGTPAENNEFPHMALIGFGETDPIWSCGGTLISETCVLTAAHCHEYNGKSARYVRLGQIDRSFKNSVEYHVEKFTPHPSYAPPNNYDDIALIQLDREVRFRPNIRPACLPKYVDEPFDRLIATGWGTTEFSGKDSEKLLKATLEKFTYEECRKSYDDDETLPNGLSERTQICAGHRTEDKDTCQGDSGGPLQIYHHSQYCMYTVIGVTSFSGAYCGTVGFPGVYTKVAAYLPWIEGIVWGGPF